MKSNSMVVGFLFREWYGKYSIALIQKNRPEWQKGLLNGPGGHLEKGETFDAAMRRKFKEETGLCVTNWRHFATIKCKAGIVKFFTAMTKYIDFLQSLTDEEVKWYDIKDVPVLPVIPNLKWMIPLALDNNEPKDVTIKYLS